MPYNYIITCGTSQLELGKLKKLSYSTAEAEKLIQEITYSNLPAEEFYQQHQTDALKILRALKNLKGDLPGAIGHTDNPFGAEISTLSALITQRSQLHGDLKHAFSTILASDSVAGYFCAQILALFLEQEFELAKVDIETVWMLKEDPENQETIATAMNNLVDIAFKSMKNHAETAGIQNAIVLTGGFKSTLPCLTLFAILYGIELIYIFEKSSQVQTLGTMIDLRDKSTRDEWIKKWRFVLEKGRIDKDSFMYRLINQRIENQDKIYFILPKT